MKKDLTNSRLDRQNILNNVPTKTTVLGVFDFRAFLNMAMLLSESEKARAFAS